MRLPSRTDQNDLRMDITISRYMLLIVLLAKTVWTLDSEDSVDGIIEKAILNLAPSTSKAKSTFTGATVQGEEMEFPMLGSNFSLVELDILVPKYERNRRVRLYKQMSMKLQTQKETYFKKKFQWRVRWNKQTKLVRRKRKATRSVNSLWSENNFHVSSDVTNNDVKIPVDFSDMALNSSERRNFEIAFNHISSSTCIRFSGVSPEQRRNSSFSFIQLRGGHVGCASRIGRQGGPQTMYMGSMCITPPVLIHEFLHVVGLIHEQSRPDRNENLHIRYENVIPGREHNFLRSSANKIATLGVPYDFKSIMHYSAYAFSRNGRPTMEPKISLPVNSIGGASRMSNKDIQAVNLLYNCAGPTMAAHRVRLTKNGLQLHSS